MNIGTSLKTISKNQLCSFIGTGGYVELEETDVLSDGSIVTAVAVLPLLNSRNDKGDGILPPGYQRVEFLATSGSNYIELPDRFNFGHEEDMPNSGILLKTSDYETKATNYAFTVPVTTSVGSVPKSEFYIGRRSANESLLRVGLNGVYGLSEPYIDGKVYEASINFLNSGVIEVGAKSQNIVHNPAAYAATFYILRSVSVCRLYEAHTSSGEELTHSLIPALDPAGEPCTFDTVTKQPFYNAGTGSFRVGIATLQQVRELQLPDNTGNAVRTLYVSLPQEARTDFTAQKHLDYLTSLNWSLNVQYRDGDIPADYTKVDFLESSGTQYIEFPGTYDPNSLLARCRFILPSNNATISGARGVFGGQMRVKGNPTEFLWGHGVMQRRASGMQAIMYNHEGWDVDSVLNEIVDVQITASTYFWNSLTYPRQTIGEVTAVPMMLFAASTAEFPEFKAVGLKLLSFAWSDANNNYDLVPVLDENGVPGMWDKVNKQFFENSGTGAFIVGIKTLNDARMLNNVLPDVTAESPDSITLSLPVEASTDAPAQKALKDLADRGWSITVQYREDEIPAGYAKVAFLASSGSQYIDTGIATDGNFTISCRLQVSSSGAVWGRACTPPYDEYTGGQSWARFLSPSDSNRGLWFYYNYVGSAFSNNASRPPMWDISKPHDWVAVEGEKTVMLDGEGVTLSTQFNYVVNVENPDQRTHYIFAANGEYIYGTGKAPMKLYSFTMQDGDDKTVLDLIPVINTDGVPGMYDKVSKKFFENAGTGQFRVGLASKEAVRNLYLEPNVPTGTTINLSVPVGTTEEDTNILKANNPNYTFNIQYRS